jgi:aminoglycoside 3-N-acetyltransferase
MGSSTSLHGSQDDLLVHRVTPDELTAGFRQLGLGEGDSVIMHASLASFGVVDGGAAMVLHRLLGVLGKQGTLLMPAFSSISRHSTFHDDFSKPSCWCEGKEERHVPFIPELQRDKDIGAIAHRLCSCSASERSRHPAYSYVAVGKHGNELVREYDLLDPLLAVKKLLKYSPFVLMVGQGFDSATAVHLAEQMKTSPKFTAERALTMSSKGKVWTNIVALGCSRGFEKQAASFRAGFRGNQNRLSTSASLRDEAIGRDGELNA